MVTLSERAAQKVRELLEAEGDPSLTSLRVAVEGGGCSGFQYALGFDSGPDGDDETYEMHGVRVVVDRASLPYLTGAGVDYIDGLTGAGFQIHNPNVVSACGCGSSFQAKDEVAAADVPDADCGPGCGCA
ncbi:MAG TPA: iron-sulfur cluster insertion protein ErpA [Gaiellales bacterium]|jgi:iron-sulfur cluster assembly protein|nr:iron-sulfur cluster insertion protein ErpA [Gaiellales bacterium]